MRIISRLLAILFLTSCFHTTVAASDIDLRQSTIAPETENVYGGAMVTVNVVLKNTGDKPADGTDVTIGFPQNGFIIRIDGLPEYQRNEEKREVSARVNIPDGEEYQFSFGLLAPRSEVGKFLSMHIEGVNLLAHDQVAARWNSDVSIKITSAPTKSQIVIGGVRINPPPIGLAVWMVSAVVMFVWLRSRMKYSQASQVASKDSRIPASGIVALVMIPLGSIMMAGGMAWRDLQTLTSWKETQATILGRREVFQASKDDRSAAEISKGGQSRRVTTQKPEFALQYFVGDREVISSGFDTGSSINIGNQIVGQAAIEDWGAGKTITCWYDPSDPGVFVVRRGFGGACLFYGLLPLPLLLIGLWALREVSNSKKNREQV